MEGAQTRVQKAVFSMVSSLDKDGLRNLQAEMYRCSTKCCENKEAALDDVQGCIDRCSTKVNRAQNYIQGEIQGFQDRMQRCVMSCDDKFRVKLPSSPSEADMAKFRENIEACAVGCADDHTKNLPAMTKKMLDSLNKNKF